MKIQGKITEYRGQDFAHEHVGPHKLARIWVIVADQKIAKIYKKSGHSLQLIAEIKPEKARHHRYKPYLPPKYLDMEHFIDDLSLWLENAAQKNLFDRLVIIVNPLMLGSMRKKLGHHTQVRIITEINKELAQLSESELQAELDKIICF